jgi:uncharacterized protein YcfL
MRKYLLVAVLLAVLIGCTTETLIHDQNPEETTLALQTQSEKAPAYKFIETEDRHIILLNTKTNKQEFKIVNNDGFNDTLILFLLLTIGVLVVILAVIRD